MSITKLQMLEQLANQVKATDYNMDQLSKLPLTVELCNQLFDSGLIGARYADALAQIFDPSYDW